MGTIALRRPLPRATLAAAAALALLALLLALRGGTSESTPLLGAPEREAIVEAPLSFEPNAGRFDERFEFVSHSVAGGSFYLNGREALLRVPGPGPARDLRLDFHGAAATAPVALERLPGRANSFIGDDPSRWRRGIPTYSAVRYRSVYPGIDLEFHGDQRALEYDFRLAPHADPSRIAVGLAGADSIHLDRSGDLAIELGKSSVRQHAPVAYQWIDGERRVVPAAFDLRGSTLGFRLGEYDRSRPLVIDPVLTHSTYLGGSLKDFGFDIEVDDQGAAYLSGQVESPDFPLQDHKYPDQALADAFITKFNPAVEGQKLSLAYSTYLGASGDDHGASLAIDDEGAVYVSGSTDSPNFPTVDPLAGPAGGNLGSTDAYVTKFSPDTGGMVDIAYSTYLSATVTEFATGLAVDSKGSAYVIGSTDSADFPVVNNFQANQTDGDIFVTMLNPDSGGPVTLAYSTYLGGTGNQERASDIAVDDLGAAYIVGHTDGEDFPTQDEIEKNEGGFDLLVIKIFPYTGAPVTLAYSTYLGGSQGEFGSTIAVDSTRAAHIAGNTDSADFPTVLPFETNQGDQDGFVAKINPDTGGPISLAYSTYLGGGLSDGVSSLAIDSEDNAVVSGSTLSEEFPVSIEPLYGNMADRDGFVTELTHTPGKNVEVPFSTYLGGSGVDEANAVAIGPQDALYVAGSTTSTDFPLRDEFQTDQPLYDVFALRLGEPAAPQGPLGPSGPQTDRTAPETTITKRPKKVIRTKARRARAVFRFTSSEPGSRFECALNRQTFSSCTAPVVHRLKAKAKARRHSFRVRAVDAAGNTDQSPAKARFKVRRKRQKILAAS